MRLVAIAVVLLTMGACAGPLSRARSQFIEGQYPEAKQDLIALEAESRTWGDAKRAEYALYRGLTYGALGDRERAREWLHEAKTIDDAHPGSLSNDDARRLRAGIESTGLP